MVTLAPLRKEEKKNEETNPIFGSSNPWCDLFGMWGTDSGGHLHSKNRLVSYKQHEVTHMQKSHYCSSCQYTHRCGVPASWAA